MDQKSRNHTSTLAKLSARDHAQKIKVWQECQNLSLELGLSVKCKKRDLRVLFEFNAQGGLDMIP